MHVLRKFGRILASVIFVENIESNQNKENERDKQEYNCCTSVEL
jgi:hypothetical protein